MTLAERKWEKAIRVQNDNSACPSAGVWWWRRESESVHSEVQGTLYANVLRRLRRAGVCEDAVRSRDSSRCAALMRFCYGEVYDKNTSASTRAVRGCVLLDEMRNNQK